MIRINTEQLKEQLYKFLSQCYLLFGNDLFLLQESQNHIIDQAKTQQFNEYFSFTIDSTTDWCAIFDICQLRSLFSGRQILLLILADECINKFLKEKLLQLTSLLHKDLLLILRGNNLNKNLENGDWFKALSPISVLVHCVTPEQNQLSHWVVKRATSIKMRLDNAACQLLCYCYEGNLLALTNMIELLSLLYPDGNLTFQRIEKIVNTAAHFTPVQWTNAVLSGNFKRAAYILHQLKMEDTEPVILLRNIQREVMMLLVLKKQTTISSLHSIFDSYKIWKQRRVILTQALARLTMMHLRKSIALMTKIEISIKKNDLNYIAWYDLNDLALLLAYNKLSPTAI